MPAYESALQDQQYVSTHLCKYATMTLFCLHLSNAVSHCIICVRFRTKLALEVV